MIHQYRFSGVTLVELLLVIAIGAMIAAFGTPPMLDWLARHNINTLSLDLARDMHFARAAATFDGAPVTLCATRTGSQCDASSTLSEGWIVFVNSDNDSPARRDPDEPILRVHEAAARVRTHSNRVAFHFRPMGIRGSNGTVIACAPGRNAAALAIVVSYTGRARVIAAPNRPACAS